MVVRQGVPPHSFDLRIIGFAPPANGFAHSAHGFGRAINVFEPHAWGLALDSNHFEPAAFISDSEITLLDLPEHGLDAKENGLRSRVMNLGFESYVLSLCAHGSRAEEHDLGLRVIGFSSNSNDSGSETNGLAFGATVFGRQTYVFRPAV
jgi:hypothetical protein